MVDDSVVKAASGLAGGIGRMDDVCGGLLGASLMLGAYAGRGREELENKEKLDNACVLVGKLYKWFEKEFGSVNCREIRTRFAGGVYYDSKVKWQAELAKEAGIPDKCVDLTAKAAAKTTEMLWDAIEEAKKK